MASLGTLTGSAKREAVKSLLDKLTQDLDSGNLSTQARDAVLEELKIYGRDPTDSDALYTKESMATLAKHAFKDPSSSTSLAALRVICNAMLLKEETRQMFVDLGYEAQVCSQFKNDTWDDEFLVARLLFVTTYGTTLDFAKLVEEHQFAETVTKKLAKHAERSKSPKATEGTPNPMEEMALMEVLRLLYNVSRVCPATAPSLSSAIPHILALFCNLDAPASQRPLDVPVSPVLHSLLNLKFDSNDAQAALFPEGEISPAVEKLVKLLDLSVGTYSDAEIDAIITPLILVITVLYSHAPEHTREYLRGKLLPAENDRENVLGQGDSLPARLLRNSTNPVAPQFGATVSELFFNMSNNDASTFVQNVGYGFASGFLFQRNIPVPDSVREAHGGASGQTGRAINPITGQFLDSETAVPEGPPMTDEEKQREAERLFVLFERLKSLGLVNVENPVTQAVQEGRFEELPDDDEYDSDDKRDP
ncbi:guanine nucleotide exchange factor [Podospora conica]|nr:guanine nucleotide exchange factor [Schizothecium conicum]